MLENIIQHFGIKEINEGTWIGNKSVQSDGTVLDVFSPVNGELIAKVRSTDQNAYRRVVEESKKAFREY